MDDDRADKPMNGQDHKMADGEKTEKFRRMIGILRIAVVVLCIVVIALIVAFALVATQLQTKLDSKTESCPSNGNDINLAPPEVVPPFHDLTRDEISAIKEFLYGQPDLNLVHPEAIGTNTSYIYTMELNVPNKAVTLNHLDKGRAAPSREAKVYVFRGDKPAPYVEEFVVGPLPNPVYKNNEETRSFLYRPLTTPELTAAITILTHTVHNTIGNVITESYGGSLMDCEDNCVGFKMISTMSPMSSGEMMARKMWFWLHPDVEFFITHSYDFLVLMDLTSNNWDEYAIDKIFYGGQKFDSLEDLKNAYEFGSVEKTRMSYPLNDRELFSSMNRRGNLFPEKPLPPPREFEPMGKRYSINGRHIKYMNWDFDVRMSTISGPQLFDIRYNNERIVYELSLQDIAVFYSADSPAVRFADYVDSVALIGSRIRSLVPGADCPTHSTFLSADHVVEFSEEPFRVEHAFCVFEHNTGKPLRRHLSSSGGTNKFYEGMADIVFTVRTIATVINYDYVFDFTFHQNGAVEVTAISTGYIITTKRFSPEDKYGFRLREQTIGNIHHHMFHFKADMDIHGTKNRFETIEIKPVKVDNTLWSSKDGARYAQTEMVRQQVQKENRAALKYNFDNPKYLTFYNDEVKSEFGVPRAYRLLHKGMSKQMVKQQVQKENGAALKYNFDNPKYLTFYNDEVKSEFGVPRAYRLLHKGMSKQLVEEGSGQEPSISWARYQLAVTKYKEEEKRSSSMYAIWDAADPVVDFRKFVDDEVIYDEDQVVWVTMGVHHIPHMEDFPVTPTVGLDLSFYLLPYNYFDEDPAMGSSDAIRVEPRHQMKLNRGLKVFRYGVPENAQCIPQATSYDKDVDANPNIVFDTPSEFDSI